MQPTKCYRVAGYALMDSVQLDYLNRYFLYMRAKVQKELDPKYKPHIKDYREKREEVKKAIKEGLHQQPFLKRIESYQPDVLYTDVFVQLEEGTYYFPGKEGIYSKQDFYQEIKEIPKNLPSFKLSSIKKITVQEITNKYEQIHCDKWVCFEAEILSEGKCSTHSMCLTIKEGAYLCVERSDSWYSGQLCDYLSKTKSYKQEFIRQFFERRIDLALLGHGDLMKYKDLPIITDPLRIKEISS